MSSVDSLELQSLIETVGVDKHLEPYVLKILEEYSQTGESELFNQIFKADFRHRPVSPEEFILSKDYIGKYGQNMHSSWIDEYIEILSPDSRITNVVLAGAIGCGKSTFSCMLLLYKLYYLSCLKDPQRYYGLMTGSDIIYGIFNRTLEKTNKPYNLIRAIVDDSPYFIEYFPRVKKTKKSNSLVFPNNIEFIVGSTELHALGDNLLSCFIDEANFYRGSTKENSPENIAEAIYSATDRRLTSRFQIGTEVPGLIIIASSERTEEDFVKKLIQKNRDRPDFKVISKALWEVKPAKYFSGKKFRVFIGDATRSSRILEDDAVVPEEDQARVIEVPVEYRKSFESNLDACFTGDTKISLLDGREVEIQDLVGLDEFWVYGVTPSGKVLPCRGHDARVTKIVTRLCEVTLDNGEIIRCTPEHRFIMRDGSEKQAQYLTPEDNLMSLYRDVRDITDINERSDDGYEVYLDNESGDWVFTHRSVVDNVLGGYDSSFGRVAHHVDFNKRNNDPRNLILMSDKDHFKLHSEYIKELWSSEDPALIETREKIRQKISERTSQAFAENPDITRRISESMKSVWSDPEFREKMVSIHQDRCRNNPEYRSWLLQHNKEVLTRYNKSDEHRAVASYVGKHYGFGTKNPTDKQIAARESNARFLSEYNKINNVINNPMKDPEIAKRATQKALETIMSRPKEWRSEYTRRGLHKRWHVNRGIVNPDCKYCNPDNHKPNNHKVISVKLIDVEPTPVYDITVDETHNFALSAGVFVHNSIRDIAGRATVSVSPLIKDREYLREIMETSDLKHPFTKEVLTSSHLANTPRLKSYLDLNYLCKIQQSQYKPRRNPDAKRYIHIDLSVSGCATGFCMTHIPSFRRVAKVDEHGVVYYTLSPYIVVDMIVKIEPPVVGEIDYEDIREFVYYLSGLGFKIGEISTDGFQSVDMRQQFNKAGYNTSVVSVDRNDLAYLTMLSAINEDRLDVYLYEPLYEQLITLQHDIIDGKVHKSSSGEKDVSDALAGATYLAMLRESKSTTTYSGKTINRSVKVKSGDDQVQTEAAENRLSEKILSGALLGYRR